VKAEGEKEEIDTYNMKLKNPVMNKKKTVFY
jgi:hypothetical protein